MWALLFPTPLTKIHGFGLSKASELSFTLSTIILVITPFHEGIETGLCRMCEKYFPEARRSRNRRMNVPGESLYGQPSRLTSKALVAKDEWNRSLPFEGE